MTTSVQIVENITKVYENGYVKSKGNKISKPSPDKYVDEVSISIEGKKKQILENIVLEAIDELPTKIFEK